MTVYVERNINMIRLDKFLSEMGLGTRSEVKKLIKAGQIAVNGTVAVKPETKVDTAADEVSVNGRIIKYQRYEYYLFNKPQAVFLRQVIMCMIQSWTISRMLCMMICFLSEGLI